MTIQQNKPDYLFIVLLILILLSIIFNACNPSRKIEKAEQIVISHQTSLDKIGQIWIKLNPCANDTTFRIVHGEDLVQVDTLYSFLPSEIVNKIDTITIIKTLKRVDTIHISVLDKQLVNLLTDSIHRLIAYKSYQVGKIEEIRSELSSSNEENTKLKRYIFIAAILVISFIGVKTYIKYKL